VCEAVAHIARWMFVCAVLGAADSQSYNSDIYNTKKDICNNVWWLKQGD
jgi:hypothetical protein